MLIAIEGIDGCGKGTLTTWVSQLAATQSLSVATFSFPRYGNNAYAIAISRYLNGEFGNLNQVAPEFAAILYAGDRLVAREELLAAQRKHDLVICDRYVPSNMAHQAAKLPPPKRHEFLAWLEEIEYTLHGLPRPDQVIRLDMPVTLSRELVGRKKARDYTDLPADIHESDEAYLAACASVYDQLVAENPEYWLNIKCVSERGALLPIETIGTLIWNALQPRLHAKGSKAVTE